MRQLQGSASGAPGNCEKLKQQHIFCLRYYNRTFSSFGFLVRSADVKSMMLGLFAAFVALLSFTSAQQINFKPTTGTRSLWVSNAFGLSLSIWM